MLSLAERKTFTNQMHHPAVFAVFESTSDRLVSLLCRQNFQGSSIPKINIALCYSLYNVVSCICSQIFPPKFYIQILNWLVALGFKSQLWCIFMDYCSVEAFSTAKTAMQFSAEIWFCTKWKNVSVQLLSW